MDTKNGHRFPLADSHTVSESVVTAVADVKNVDPVALSPPLYDAINPDALDSVIASLDTGCVHFEYSDLQVTVKSDEIIVVPADD